MPNLKYVVCKRKADGHLVFALGQDVFSHNQLAFHHEDYVVDSAGFVALGLWGPKCKWSASCGGKSVILKVPANPARDGALILNALMTATAWFYLIEHGVEQLVIVSPFDEQDRLTLLPWQMPSCIIGQPRMLATGSGLFVPGGPLDDPPGYFEALIRCPVARARFTRAMNITLDPY